MKNDLWRKIKNTGFSVSFPLYFRNYLKYLKFDLKKKCKKNIPLFYIFSHFIYSEQRIKQNRKSELRLLQNSYHFYQFIIYFNIQFFVHETYENSNR